MQVIVPPNWEETTSYVISKEEKKESEEEESIVTLEQKEKMVFKDIQGEESKRFVYVLAEFLRLLINGNSQIRGVDIIS